MARETGEGAAMKLSNRLRLGLVGLLGGLLAMQVPVSPGEAQVAPPRPFATLPSAHSVQGLAFDCIQVWFRSSNWPKKKLQKRREEYKENYAKLLAGSGFRLDYAGRPEGFDMIPENPDVSAPDTTSYYHVFDAIIEPIDPKNSIYNTKTCLVSPAEGLALNRGRNPIQDLAWARLGPWRNQILTCAALTRLASGEKIDGGWFELYRRAASAEGGQPTATRDAILARVRQLQQRYSTRAKAIEAFKICPDVFKDRYQRLERYYVTRYKININHWPLGGAITDLSWARFDQNLALLDSQLDAEVARVAKIHGDADAYIAAEAAKEEQARLARASNGPDFRPAPEDDRDAVCARYIRSFKSELEEAARLVSRKMLFCDRKAGIVNSMRVAARGAEAANCPISMDLLADSIRTVENGSCLNSVVPRYTP